MSRERRRHVRKRVNLSGTVREGSGAAVVATVVDMSLGGAFVQLDPTPAFGAAVTLEVALGGELLTLAGTVRWVKGDGVGVQFGSLGARDTFLLTETLAKAEPVPDSRRPEDG